MQDPVHHILRNFGSYCFHLATMKVTITGLEMLKDQLQAIEKKLDEIRVPEQDRWLNNDEFCELLSISHKTAQSYRDKGLIRFSQINQKIYYRMSAIDAFLEQHGKGGYKHGRSNGTY